MLEIPYMKWWSLKILCALVPLPPSKTSSLNPSSPLISTYFPQCGGQVEIVSCEAKHCQWISQVLSQQPHRRRPRSRSHLLHVPCDAGAPGHAQQHPPTFPTKHITTTCCSHLVRAMEAKKVRPVLAINLHPLPTTTQVSSPAADGHHTTIQRQSSASTISCH